MTKKYKSIAFQGALGAFSDLSCRTVFPDLKTVPCNSFDDAFAATISGETDLAMIPVDNTIAGRVADVHHLLGAGELFIIGEHFQPVEFCLLGVKGAKKEDLKHVYSHVHALPQCRTITKELGLQAHVYADTAGAAAHVADLNDKEHGAFSSALAAQIYDLEILQTGVQESQRNTTRFLILAREPIIPEPEEGDVLSSLLFEVRNIPASLYKSLGGFATNGLSLAKLESYVDEQFQAAQFYCDVEGHPESVEFKRALEELGFYAKDVKFLGAYPAHPFRKTYKGQNTEI